MLITFADSNGAKADSTATLTQRHCAQRCYRSECCIMEDERFATSCDHEAIDYLCAL